MNYLSCYISSLLIHLRLFDLTTYRTLPPSFPLNDHLLVAANDVLNLENFPFGKAESAAVATQKACLISNTQPAQKSIL